MPELCTTKFITILTAIACLCGCDNMGDQPKLSAYEATPLLPGGTAAQPPPEHTLRYSPEPVDAALATGRVGEQFIDFVPVNITRSDLLRGQETYNAYCTPCHGYSGHGDGLVVRRGFPSPPSFHTDRLRRAPAGYLYTVLNEGYGVMLPYGNRIPLEDRWRVIAYVRTLQLSQHATPDQMTQDAWTALADTADRKGAP